MPQKRRKFDQDFKDGAVRIVIESGRPVAEVARDLEINEGTLGNWVNKAKEAKLMEGERPQRLINTVTKAVTDDGPKLAALQQAANANPADGNADVKLGESLWTYGKLPEAEAAVRKGIREGKLADPEGAKIVLGHILLSAGKKAEAAQAFTSVAKGNKWESLGRLQAIIARRG